MERPDEPFKVKSGTIECVPGEKPPASKPASSFADVARRTTSRTTDLIAIAIVLVGSLTLGRQVLQWWQADPPSASPADEAGSVPTSESGGPLVLEFGDLPLAITRQPVRGDREAAIDALVARCWEVAGHGGPSADKPDEAERRLLARIANLKPVTEEPGRRQIYLIDERFPMAAAFGPATPEPGPDVAEVGTDVAEVVRLRATQQANDPNSHEFGYEGAPATSPDSHESGYDRGSNPIEPAGSSSRLLCWGMAMPIGNSAWTLFVFRHSTAKHLSGSELPDVPLPPGARRNLSLRDIHGGGLVGFSVSGDADTLMRFYDDWFQKQGWAATQGWQAGERVWTARYRNRPGSDAAQTDVRLAEDREGELAGLIQIVPPADGSTLKKGTVPLGRADTSQEN